MAQNTRTAALAPRNLIVSSFKTVKAEDDCSRKLFVFGIAEEVGEYVQTKASELLGKLNEKPKIMDSKRFGKCAAGFTLTHPIKFRVVLKLCFKSLRKVNDSRI